MQEHLRTLLLEMEHYGRAHDGGETEHSRKLLNLEPETAQLVSILARSSRAKRVLEVGTSNGYSTIWLAASVRSLGGRVISIDRSPAKHEMARANLIRAGLLDLVDLVTGDATEVVAELPGPFDFVLFDGDRLSAPAQLALLLPKLEPGALVLADNVLSHPGEIAGYLAAIQNSDQFQHLVVPVGNGLSVAYHSQQSAE